MQQDSQQQDFQYAQLFPNYERPEPPSTLGYCCLGYCCFLQFFGVIMCLVFSACSYTKSQILKVGTDADRKKFGLHFLIAAAVCAALFGLVLLALRRRQRSKLSPQQAARIQYTDPYKGSSAAQPLLSKD